MERINATHKGIDIEDEKVSNLLYTDDLILLAHSATDLQLIWDELSVWFKINKIKTNDENSKLNN